MKEEIIIAIGFVALIIIIAYNTYPKEEWTLQFTGKLIGVKPPTFGSSGYLIFDNGKIRHYPSSTYTDDLQIGATYEFWVSNYGGTKLIQK